MNKQYLKRLMVFAALLFLLGGCAVSVGGGYYPYGYYYHDPHYHNYYYHGYWR